MLICPARRVDTDNRIIPLSGWPGVDWIGITVTTNAIKFGCRFLIVVVCAASCGCRFGEVARQDRLPNSLVKFPAVRQEIIGQWDERQAETGGAAELPDETASPPRTIASGLPDSFRDVTLEEAISIALQDTTVLRSLGAQVLVSPEAAETNLDPAITATDPLFGSAAALSEFDSQIRSTVNYANNDDVFNNLNNPLLGTGATEIQQDLAVADWGVTRIGPAGTRYSLATELLHDNNNGPTNLFDSSWRWQAEATVRKPLLQGNGVAFNQIAGPNARPGLRFSNGLLIARIDNDISSVRFARGIRDYVVNVINAYWELKESYRRYSAAIAARDAAFETWQAVRSRFENDLPGGEADSEAQSHEQYLEFQGGLIDALASDNPVAPGVLQAEADLRRLLGLPQSGKQFLRPADEPLQAHVRYEWSVIVEEALANRAEIRQQMKQVRRRELELLAAKNFTRPQLDAVATYRNNGFGDDLTGGGPRFASAGQDAINGEHDEWEFGLQYAMPLGFRRERASVRNAELNLRRERIVLTEQGRAMVHELGTAVRQVDRAYLAMDTAAERFQAARRTVRARRASWQADLATIVELLEAQRRQAESEVAWYRTATEYARANVQVLRDSGRLLGSLSIFVDECDGGFYCDLTSAESLLGQIRQSELDYRMAPDTGPATPPARGPEIILPLPDLDDEFDGQ